MTTLRIISFIFLGVFINVNAYSQEKMRSDTSKAQCPNEHSNMTSETSGIVSGSIICPFLRIVEPDSTSYKSFSADCAKYGMDYKMAKYVAKDIGRKQKGKKAVRNNDTPDLYRLDSVPGISHQDLFGKYMTDVHSWIKDREVDGQIALQDLVELKEVIASKEGVDVGKAISLFLPRLIETFDKYIVPLVLIEFL